jgi:hypothetical protein
MLKPLADHDRLLLPVMRHEMFQGEVGQVECEHGAPRKKGKVSHPRRAVMGSKDDNHLLIGVVP